MRRGARPAQRPARRLDSVADILAVALAHFAQMLAVSGENGAGITGIGPRLLAADIELGRPVDAAGLMPVGGVGQLKGRCGFELFLPGRLQIRAHAFAAALAPETGFAIAAEADGGVELVG